MRHITTLFANLGPIKKTYLLLVVGCVGQHGRHMEHDFIILVIGMQGVGSC